jgi:hypothetical protein
VMHLCLGESHKLNRAIHKLLVSVASIPLEPTTWSFL